MRYLIMICAVVALSSCGGGLDTYNNNTNQKRDIVDDNATVYTESNEANNNRYDNAELTHYTLDTNGIKISGTFETTKPSIDHYLFDTGPNTSVDIQIILDGKAMDADAAEMSTSLNAYLNDGLSTLHGLNSARGASVTPASAFVIYVVPFNVAGQSYTIQMRPAQ